MIEEMDIQNNITSGLTITGARMRYRWRDKPTFVSAVISELMAIRNARKVLITMIYARNISYAVPIVLINVSNLSGLWNDDYVFVRQECMKESLE